MYDINFIKQRIVPESRKKVIAAVVYAAGLFLAMSLLAVGSISLADFRAADVYAGEITRIRTQLTTRYPGVPSRGELETMVKRTEPHLKEIGKIVDRRVCFAPVWERIAVAVPEGVWLTRVAVADVCSGKEESRMRGGGGSRSFKGIIIEGVALAGRGPEGDQAVSSFVENLENDEELHGYVREIEFMGTGLRQVSGTSVVGFEITCPF